MEEKIYDRQVTKQSLSFRVVDQQQIERHFTTNELAELYTFEPDMADDPSEKKRKAATPVLPKVKNASLYYIIALCINILCINLKSSYQHIFFLLLVCLCFIDVTFLIWNIFFPNSYKDQCAPCKTSTVLLLVLYDILTLYHPSLIDEWILLNITVKPLTATL